MPHETTNLPFPNSRSNNDSTHVDLIRVPGVETEPYRASCCKPSYCNLLHGVLRLPLGLAVGVVMIVSGVFLSGFANLAFADESGRPPKENEIVIGSFNIRYNNRGDGEDAWPNRKQHVAQVIRDAEADIVGLQEALQGQIEDLEKALPDHAWFGVGRDDGKVSGEFVPVFYRRDRFEVIDQGHFWLSTTPEVPGSKSWDAAITRMVSWLILKDKESQLEFLFANTHFDHRGNDARRESAQLIRKRLPKLAASRPIVLTGDFNCLESDPPYQILVAEDESKQATFFDARSIASTKPEGPDSTWSGFRKVEPGRRIDFVFVSPGVSVLQHSTVDRTFDGRFPSDHLPVFAKVRFEHDTK